MAEVFLNVFGGGYATTDALPPMTDGEWFTVHLYPDADAELLDIWATDSHDYVIALPPVVDNEISMQFRSSWGNIYFEIYFSGSTPPEPPTKKRKFWLIMALKKNNERRLKPYVRN